MTFLFFILFVSCSSSLVDCPGWAYRMVPLPNPLFGHFAMVDVPSITVCDGWLVCNPISSSALVVSVAVSFVVCFTSLYGP